MSDFAEVEMEAFIDTPVAIIENGEVLETWIAPEIKLIRPPSETTVMYTTVGEVKQFLLNFKQNSRLIEMQSNPDDCYLVVVQGQFKTVVSDDVKMKEYRKTVSKGDAILVVAVSKLSVVNGYERRLSMSFLGMLAPRLNSCP